MATISVLHQQITEGQLDINATVEEKETALGQAFITHFTTAGSDKPFFGVKTVMQNQDGVQLRPLIYLLHYPDGATEPTVLDLGIYLSDPTVTGTIPIKDLVGEDDVSTPTQEAAARQSVTNITAIPPITPPGKDIGSTQK